MTDVIAQLSLLATFALTFIKTNFGTLVAVASAVFAYIQARAAKHSLRQAQLLKLFGSFDAASENTISNPELLYSVHGLSRDVPIEEARSIAYFSMLLDAFQHYYSEMYKGDFTKMVKKMKSQPTFLNRILAVKENWDRWPILNKIYYGKGGFDSGFIDAIEALIAHEKNSK